MRTPTQKLRGGLCLAALLAASATQAQTPTIVLDENGNSSGTGAAGMIYLSSQLDSQNSPVAGGINTLDYLYLPPSGFLTMGWVAIYDPGANGALSDLIHFDGSINENGHTYEQIFFYSSDNNGALADNFPALTTVNSILSASSTVTVHENSLGEAFYTPGSSSQPGFHQNGSPATSFEFVSSVPEPGTVFAGALLLAPFGAGSIRMLRKSRKA